MSEIISWAPVVKNAYGVLQQASYLFSLIIYDLQDSISVAISVSVTNFNFYNAVLHPKDEIGMAKRIGSDQTGLHCMSRRNYSDYSLPDLRLPGLLLHYFPNKIAQYDSIDH